MVLHVFIMYLPELVLLYSKVIQMKYPKFNLIHKEIKLSQQVVIEHADYGTQIQEMRSKCFVGILMISSLALSIMKVTL